ncbi:hypothetical protein Tco_0664739 [Tanacetum coccineum]
MRVRFEAVNDTVKYLSPRPKFLRGGSLGTTNSSSQKESVERVENVIAKEGEVDDDERVENVIAKQGISSVS